MSMFHISIYIICQYQISKFTSHWKQPPGFVHGVPNFWPSRRSDSRTHKHAWTNPHQGQTASCLVWSLRLLLEASIQAITRRQETRADICLSTEVQLASLIGVHRDGAGEGGRGGWMQLLGQSQNKRSSTCKSVSPRQVNPKKTKTKRRHNA